MKMTAVKLVVWACPTPIIGHHKYTVIGTVVSDKPLEGIPSFGAASLDDCVSVAEAVGVLARAVVDALMHLRVRPAKRQGLDANTYLHELNSQ